MRKLLLLVLLVPFFVPASASSTSFRPCLNATIIGTTGPDFLIGTSGRDTIRTRGGSDTVLGLGGADIICGNGGDDDLDGGDGKDFLYGGVGTDRCERKDYVVNCERGT